jgi:ribosomal-protein-alanine N-acetyltransferase
MVANRGVAENLTFRPMTFMDLDRVLANETRSYVYPWTLGVFEDCLRAAYECWVLANAADDLLGHGVLSLGPREAHLLNVCIRRDRQGEGHGRQLVLHMLQRAAVRGADMVYLEVRPSNRVALLLYASLGFKEIGRRPGYYPSDHGHEDARVLALRLGSGATVPGVSR